MQHRTLPLAAGLALLPLLASSCTRYGFDRQEIGLRHDAETDVLELLVVSHGLRATGEKSAGVVAADAAGARHVILLGWPLEFPLDEIEAELAVSDDPLAARTLAFVQGISVAEAGAWAGEDGCLSLFQRIRVPSASEGLALANEALNRACLEEDEVEDVSRKFGARAGELFAAHIREGKPWFALEGGALVVRAPISDEGAARFLEDLLRMVADEDEPLLSFAPALTALSVAEGVATLTFGPGEEGWIRVRQETPGDEDAPLPPPPGIALLSAPPTEIAQFVAGAARAGAARK